MMNPATLGIDVGATSIKAGVFAVDGRLLAVADRRNAPEQDPHGDPGWMIWDPDALWSKVCQCISEVV